MWSAVTLVSQSPSDIKKYLQPVGEFYICTNFDEEMDKPPRLTIGEHIYYRFMNYLYTPQPPESLSPDKVIELCDLRLDYINKLVNYGLNKRVVAAIVDHIKSTSDFHKFSVGSSIKALDFGCGSGLSSKLLLEHLPNLEIVGADISEKAIQHATRDGVCAIQTYPGKPLPFKDASFDLIFAVFVMHFSIDMSTLAELRRVLRTPGKFVFNLYQRDIDGVKQQLEEVGFCSIEVSNDLPQTGRNHMIVSCS